jgi:hypothetical protein
MGDHKKGAIVAPSPDRSEKGVTDDSAKKRPLSSGLV